MPKVSVIMPCFNVERYIGAAIQSVLGQTFTDFELIIVDDGATDGSEAVYMSFADPRIRIVRQTNRGLAGARNTGIRQARGQFIALLDSDDLWHPQKLEKHVAHLESGPRIGVSYSQSVLIDENGLPLGVTMRPQLTGIDAATVLCRNPIGNGSAPVMRAEVFRDIAFRADRRGEPLPSYFDEGYRYLEDVECWMRIAVLTRWRMEGIGEPLTLYRVVSGGLSANTDRMYEFWNRMLARVEGYAPDLVARHGQRARAYQVRYYARRAVVEGQGLVALGRLRAALALHPAMLVEEPKKTIVTFAGALAAWILPASYFRRLEGALRR